MTDTVTIERDLIRTQSRRKAVIVLAALLAVPLLLLTRSAWSPGSWQHYALEEGGLLLIVVAILGRAWCTLYIGGRKVKELVRTGPYSVTRNPLYDFSFIACAGLGAQTGSLAMALLVPCIAYLIFLPVVRREEIALRQIHGADFDAYSRSVPRFAVRPTAWIEASNLEINPRHWRRTTLDGLVFLLLVPLIRSVGEVQQLMLVPQLQLI